MSWANEVHESKSNRNAHHYQRDRKRNFLFENFGEENTDGRSRECGEGLVNFARRQLDVQGDAIGAGLQLEGHRTVGKLAEHALENIPLFLINILLNKFLGEQLLVFAD